MKQLLLAALAFISLNYCSNAKTKNENKMEKTSTVSVASDVLTEKPVTCKLTTPELRERKYVVLSALKKQVIERKELPSGYSYKFSGTDEMLDAITSFIKAERLCCDFFNFKLSVTNDFFMVLEISVAKGAKEVITTELEM